MKYFLKIISYFFGLLIFTIIFFLLQVSSSVIDITSSEVFFKPYLIRNADQYNINIHKIQLYIDKSQHKLISNIKIDFINKANDINHRFSSTIDLPIISFIELKSQYQFSLFHNDSNENNRNLNSDYSFYISGFISSEKVALKGEGSELSIDLVKTLWPKNIAKGARFWVNRNLSKGKIKNLTFDITLPLESYQLKSKLSKKDLNLKFNFEEMKISFLRGMSSIYDASGEAFLDGEIFKSNLSEGKIRGIDHNEINLVDSYFIAHNFQKRHGPGEVEINARGDLKDLLLFLFQHPKDLKRFIQFDVKNISSFSTTNVNFKFPLKSKISFEEIQISSLSNLQNTIIDDLYSQEITSDNLKVSVSSQEINIAGDIVIDSQSLKFNWDQVFTSDENSASLALSGFLNDKFLNKNFKKLKLNFDGKSFLDTRFYGDLNGFREGSISLDCRPLGFESGLLLWTKPKFTPLKITSEIKFIGEKKFSLEKVNFNGPLISILGDLNIEDSVVREVNFPIIKLYSSKNIILSNFSLSFSRDILTSAKIFVGGSKITLGKDSLFKFFDFKKSNHNSKNISLDLSIDKLTSGSGINYDKVKFLLEKDNKLINILEININLNNEKIITSKFSGTNIRNIEFYSKNIESIIDIMGVDVNIIGGPLYLVGSISNNTSDIFEGNLLLEEFSILKLPIFAKLLNISLPDLSNLLNSNSGIKFKSASALIKISNKGINIVDGVIKAKSDIPIFGNSLGMTMSGLYGISNKTDISGTLVPFAGFNTAPSKLPLLGGLFKGDQKGQGLIGINFRIYEDENGFLDIQSNPLSILTPGFLQRIF